MEWLITIGVGFVAAALGAGAGWFLYQKLQAQKLEASRSEAKDVVEKARQEAAAAIKAAEIKAKEEDIRRRDEAEREIRAKQKDIRNLEKRVQSREAALDKKTSQLDEKEQQLEKAQQSLSDRQKGMEVQEAALETKIGQMQERLEKVAGMTAAEAKGELMEAMAEEARKSAAKRVRAIEAQANEEAQARARRILSLAIQRYAGEQVAETTVSMVSLPDDQMKGRIIGREGRNIRALEAAAGCDLIIDDTPEAIIVSGHNPIRRAVTKAALEKLVHDGRIHPGRIESVVKQAEKEIDQQIREAGEQAALEAGAHGLHKELIRLLGTLRFKQIQTHNILQHCLEVSAMAGLIAAELGLDEKLSRRAGLLHDIGKAVDHDAPGTHPHIGADVLKRHGESRELVEAVLGHHDESPSNLYSVILQAADQLSNARPGARRETMGAYIQRLADLEAAAVSFPGATRAYAVQAGRELYVVVDHKIVDDDQAALLARDIAGKIENEMNYPGQVHVTVIRERRSVHYAT